MDVLPAGIRRLEPEHVFCVYEAVFQDCSHKRNVPLGNDEAGRVLGSPCFRQALLVSLGFARAHRVATTSFFYSPAKSEFIKFI